MHAVVSLNATQAPCINCMMHPRVQMATQRYYIMFWNKNKDSEIDFSSIYPHDEGVMTDSEVASQLVKDLNNSSQAVNNQFTVVAVWPRMGAVRG